MAALIAIEDVLGLIAFGLDILVAPGRHLNGSDYEQWLERFGWRRRLEVLRQEGILERSRQGTQWVYRLTDAANSQARIPRDPETMWNRQWDGWWRQIVFDLPVQPGHVNIRTKLLRWLRRETFGYLQDSVWIRTDPIPEISDVLQQFGADATLVAVLESRCVAGSSNAALVKAAWPFDAIDQGYRQYEEFAAKAQRKLRAHAMHPRDLFSILRDERQLWKSASSHDPLLPRDLWPANYRGPSIWRIRRTLIREIAKHLPTLCG